MKGDFSRFTFNKKKHYSSVLMQQGRVQIDADWNEQQAINCYLSEIVATDVIGPCGVPKYGGGFKIEIGGELTTTLVYGGSDLSISPGRIYVDGILCEAESGGQSYTKQPDYFPAEEALADNGKYLVYVDVWKRHITSLDAPEIPEKALGGIDTTTRVKTVWQVKLHAVGPNETCSHFGSDWMPPGTQATGKMTARISPAPESDDLCKLSSEGGYQRLENQLYRVEIHKGGLLGEDDVTFKWSRDNGTVTSLIQSISGKTVTLDSIGPDDLLSFKSGNWVEIINDSHELNGVVGQLLQIEKVFRERKEIELSEAPSIEIATVDDGVDRSLHPKVRRWDSSNETEIDPDQSTWYTLEGGIELRFDSGTYRTGDYWLVPARTTPKGMIEWPKDEAMQPIAQLRHGIEHHYCPLALVERKDGSFIQPVHDCRKEFVPLTEIDLHPGSTGIHCCSVTVGDDVHSWGDFNSIEGAVKYLREKGGKICILPGQHETNVVIENSSDLTISGCGKQTIITPGDIQKPIFKLVDCQNITLENMDMVTFSGTAIFLAGTRQIQETGLSALQEIEIANNRIIGCENGVYVDQGIEFNGKSGSGIHIHSNKIRMLDKEGAGCAIRIRAEDSLIERNNIGVLPAKMIPSKILSPGDTDTVLKDPSDDCADDGAIKTFYRSFTVFKPYITFLLDASIESLSPAPYRALGGIQVIGGSERVGIADNSINGGAGNGITLGGFLPVAMDRLSQGEEETEHTLQHGGGTIRGKVSAEGKGLDGIAVIVGNAGKKKEIIVNSGSMGGTGEGMFFKEDVAAGEYSIAVATPGFKIEEVKAAGSDEFNYSNIRLVKEEVDFGDLIAFLYDITISRNSISSMGLSGIGIAKPESSEQASSMAKTAAARSFNSISPFLALLGNQVINLDISDNRITGCLQSSSVAGENIAPRGMGGISLGLCENLSVERNRIENNGRSYLTPVCGIFLSFGEQAVIAHNSITNNGPLIKTAKMRRAVRMQDGVRGGIVMLASSLNVIDETPDETFFKATARPACRIHDNIVDQPAGKALSLLAVGPVSIQNNHFNAELSGPEDQEKLVGAVQVFNFGQSHSMVPSKMAPSHFMDSARMWATGFSLPSGNILFCGNQTRLGSLNKSMLTQFIYSQDDIGFSGNQSDSLGRGIQVAKKIFLVINTMLWGETVRSTANRFKEMAAIGELIDISLFSCSNSMNNTTDNQGDHCIIAFNKDSSQSAIDRDNLVVTNNEHCEALLQFIVKELLSLRG